MTVDVSGVIEVDGTLVALMLLAEGWFDARGGFDLVGASLGVLRNFREQTRRSRSLARRLTRLTDRMAHPFDAFERIYIINLASRADRRAEMADQLKKIGLSMATPSIRLFEAVRPPDAGHFPSIGARGCFMSHLGVLQDAADAGLQCILILEDDLNFSADFMSRAPAVMAAALEAGYDLFYGGYQVAPVPPSGSICEIDPKRPIVTAHFISFSGSAIAATAAYLKAMLSRQAGDSAGGPMHVDGAYSWFRRENPERRTLIAVPELGYQRSSRTDIHTLRWFDRTPVARSFVGALRRLRNG